MVLWRAFAKEKLSTTNLIFEKNYFSSPHQIRASKEKNNNIFRLVIRVVKLSFWYVMQRTQKLHMEKFEQIED
jgi:hypothetical protein